MIKPNKIKDLYKKLVGQNIPKKTYEYYHKHTFWNDHYLIRNYLNKLASGDENTDWMHYLYQNYLNNKKNIKMLSVVCGNGWQDRSLDKIFNFKSVDGYDISNDLLKIAQKESTKKFAYHYANLNKDNIKRKNFDLAINIAGLHHIENMDHAIRQVYQALKPGGLFVNYDYIGPKRNQYSDDDLKYMNQMQHKFPKELVGRQPIVRPSIKIMLKEDPSEAVGSENIIPTLKKYFDIDYLKYLNGGMLYQVLYNQIQNFDPNNNYHNNILKKNIVLEKKLSKKGKVKPLFAFIICIKK